MKFLVLNMNNKINIHTKVMSSIVLLALSSQHKKLHNIFIAKAQSPDSSDEPALQATAQLEIEINGYKEKNSLLRISLFRSADGFPSQVNKAIQSKTIYSSPDKTIVMFDGLELNQKYAVAVLEDANENGKLDTNLLGIPKEGVAVSGNPSLWLGAPKFPDCTVSLVQPLTVLNLKLYHFF